MKCTANMFSVQVKWGNNKLVLKNKLHVDTSVYFKVLILRHEELREIKDIDTIFLLFI